MDVIQFFYSRETTCRFERPRGGPYIPELCSVILADALLLLLFLFVKMP